MTPPPNADDVCGNCFLYERRGVCPAAQDAYDLQNSTAAQRRAEQFRQAVAQDSLTIVTLAELVRLDGQHQHPARLLPVSSPLTLPKAAAKRTAHDSRKEAIHVVASRTPR